jgi:hypothetical protein
LDPAALRRGVAARLPEHLVPGAIVPVPALPRTATGKLDTAALPAPSAPTAATHRAPCSADEQRLCGIYADLLGVDSVGIDDSFFDLGGHPSRPAAPGAAGMAAEPAAESLLAHPGLASLPRHQREAVLLASCGYIYRQIADLAGVPAVTVAERLRDGLLALGSRSE